MAIISYDNGTFINCICNYEDGETYDPDKPFEIVGINGAVFEGNFVYGLRNLDYGDYSTETFIKSNEDNKLVPNFNDYGIESCWKTNYRIELKDNYIAIGGEVETNEFTNIYLITNTELSELSKVRYTNIDDELQDLGIFITNLYKLPFILPSEIVVETKTDIMLGNNKVNVKSSLVNTDRLVIDFGDIEVPEKYHNVYDFINTTCILHLPYFDNIYIDNEYVIGQTINVKYVIDLYSGDCSVNIYSSFLGDIMETRQSNITQSIPFIQSNYNSIVGGLSSVNKNLIEKPFIEVVRNKPYNKSLNIFGNNVVEYGKIGDYQGFLQCDKIVLETKATNQEQEEIKNILRNGVFI
jgi:hypothetical protein